jgi:hypothetical protein
MLYVYLPRGGIALFLSRASALKCAIAKCKLEGRKESIQALGHWKVGKRAQIGGRMLSVFAPIAFC